MGGPDMAPQTPHTFGAPGMNPGAPLSPSPHTFGAPGMNPGAPLSPRPPHARGAPAKPWHPSILRQAPCPRRAGGRADLTRPRQRRFIAPTREVPMRSDRVLSTIDFHTAGIGVRLLTTGLRRRPGAPIAEKGR